MSVYPYDESCELIQFGISFKEKLVIDVTFSVKLWLNLHPKTQRARSRHSYTTEIINCKVTSSPFILYITLIK